MRVGLLWRAEWDPPHPDGPVVAHCKLREVFAAFAALGVPAEPVVYSDETAAAVREQLLGLDGVLVWVNPIEQGRDRSRLDPLLREVAEADVWVSAHPDVILKMATKKVLVDTREMDWGSDTRLYTSARELGEQLPGRLEDGKARVLKQQRGMGGQGVWKVELHSSGPDPWIVVQEGTRSGAPARVRLSEFISRCEAYFGDGGLLVEQPFQQRIAEGMIRCYLSHDRVVGFAHQHPAGLRPASAGEPPAGKTFELPSAPAYATLRDLMESTWTPQMQRIVGVETHALPVIWDADFLYGPKTDSGDDTYVLCEINASSTFAFPEHAMPTVAQAALDRIAARRS
ncbi:MAG: Cj0069 family protein [Acidimicrobiia bacterium]